MGSVFGSAQSQLGGSDVWFFAKPGRQLPAGTVVKTEAGSYCLVFFSDGTKLRLGPKSYLRVAELSADKTMLSLGSGRMEAWVKKRGGAAFQVQTPLFTSSQAEGSFVAEILSPTSATLDVFSGGSSVQDSLGKEQGVSAGSRAEFDAKTGVSTPAPQPAGTAAPQEPSLSGPAKPVSAAAPVKKAPAAAAKVSVQPKPAAPAKQNAPVPAQKTAEPAKSDDQGIDSQL
jgi:hypothetical protein